MACWTNFEIRKLVEMHRDRTPPLKELVAAFPRHTFSSIKWTAFHQGLRHLDNPPHLKWIRIAHRHFSKVGA